MTKELKTTVRGAGRVGFLARLDGIKQMAEAGYPLLSIYQKYESDVGISYSQFVKYVNRYIRSKPTNEIKPEQAKAVAPIRKPRDPGTEQPKFRRSENRDDLINPKPKE